MNTLRLALALFALAAASTSSLARADIANSGKTTAALSVGASVLATCSLNEREDGMDVNCERAPAPRVEQSDVFAVQIGEQQALFTTTTINF